jgi:hypothetical protein
LIRQSLSIPQITSVIALARKSVDIPKNHNPGANVNKFKSVVVKDYDDYSENVRKEFTAAYACIWSVR